MDENIEPFEPLGGAVGLLPNLEGGVEITEVERLNQTTFEHVLAKNHTLASGATVGIQFGIQTGIWVGLWFSGH
jgi:hypothetical protein